VAQCDIRAEAAVLGSVILDNTVYDTVRLSVEDFYREQHRMIWAAMGRLASAGKAIDIITLKDELGEEWRKVGGPLVVELSNNTPASLNVNYYASIVRGMAQRRAIVDLGRRLQVDRPDDPVEDVVNDAVRRVLEIGRTKDHGCPVRLVDALRVVMGDLDRKIDRNSLIHTGWVDVDNMLPQGLAPGTVTVVAARPSMGKTALATQIALHASLTGHPALFVSLEMAESELTNRLLALQSRVSLSRIVAHDMDEQDWRRVCAAVACLGEAPLTISEPPGQSLADIQSTVREQVRLHGVKLVVIDYLGLIKSALLKGRNREQEVAEISRGVKIMAREQRVAVILVSQLSRGPESRQDRRPTLSDLRESGSIEQDADLVMLLYRDDYYHEDSKDAGIAEVRIAKQRNGGTGTAKLHWERSCCRFDDLSDR
jgi:replicative DNA helicase